MLDKRLIHTPGGTEHDVPPPDGLGSYHVPQNDLQLETYELLVFGIFHLTFSDHGWLWVSNPPHTKKQTKNTKGNYTIQYSKQTKSRTFLTWRSYGSLCLLNYFYVLLTGKQAVQYQQLFSSLAFLYVFLLCLLELLDWLELVSWGDGCHSVFGRKRCFC